MRRRWSCRQRWRALSAKRSGGGPDALRRAEWLHLSFGRSIADLALANHLPSIHAFTQNVVAGGLLSYAPSVADVARRGAVYVDRILRGAKPADLPIEQPTKFELIINLKTAKALGLTIPPSLLARADPVIDP
jgi:putative tryptophan/tyrosine transport system substrate-binding protein